ncbi:MAG: low-specificity L-threonine aldolase [Candidatus Krumholzibacteriia bacterium]
MSVIDLRSDTVTRPTPGMRRAMAEAEVGDDVFGDDPTVLRLQDEVAELLGKEAALYVPSGTMGNQLALMAQTRPGDQVLLEAGAHIYNYEGGAPGALSGVHLTPVAGSEGVLSWADVAAAVHPDDVHFAPPRLLCLENTHNGAGGRILPQETAQMLAHEAHQRGLRVHLDGARLWNAHVAAGLPLDRLAAPVDTVSVCFSKGLGAPVGSALAGDAETIRLAHRYRKRLGGGMRQVGILAAACLYALEHHLERLAEDHAHARRLAEGLENPALAVNHAVQTNIVIIDVAPPATPPQLLEHLRGEGVLAVGFGAGRIRLVPHLGVSAAEVEASLAALNTFPGAAA